MKTETRIRVAAAIALFTALWTILPDWRSHLFFLRNLQRHSDIAELPLAISWVLCEAVLLVHIVSAFVLFRIRRWAGSLLVIALSVQILLTSFTAIRFSFFPPPPPPPIEGVFFVIEISLWPNYFRALLNALAVILLFSPKVRAYFRKSNKETHNQALHGTADSRADASASVP